MKIAIHGSCCSREIFNSLSDTLEVGTYFFQNPFFTWSSTAFPFDVKLDDIPVGSNFMKRMVFSELKKTAKDTLRKEKADYLMIDVADCRLGQLVLSFANGEKCKVVRSDDTKKTLSVLQKKYDFTITEESAGQIQNWDELLDEYVKDLLEIYSVDRIILNKIMFAERYEENGELKRFTKETAGATWYNRELLILLQEKLQQKLKGSLVLEPPPFEVVADSLHRLGLHMFHYKKEVYDYQMRRLQELLVRPKVSVILPCYNTAAYLEQALDSVIWQTLKDLEIICVNDGSTDNSLEIMKRYAEKDPRIVILDGPNGGYGKAMNRGLDYATGEYIGILEPDDYLMLNMYETLYQEAKNNNLDIIKADFYRFAYGKENYNHLSNNKDDYRVVCKPWDKLETFLFIMNTWSGIYRRDFIEAYHIRHQETPGASFQDNGFWFQTFCFAERVMFWDEPFYMNRRDNPNSSVKNKAKVYCMNDEYHYIGNLLRKDKKMWEHMKDIYLIKKYHNYIFTLGRIEDCFKWQYVQDISKEFREDMNKNGCKETFFTSRDKEKLKQLMNAPLAFYGEIMAEGDKRRAENPVVSVILPVYNVEKFLPQCLNSLINQTLNNIEIICVDDGSSDLSAFILDDYAKKDSRVKVLYQENLGAGVARNKGLEIAKGRYLSFLDSDDFFEFDMLESIVNKCENDEADIGIYDVKLFDEKEKKNKDVSWIVKRKFIPDGVFSYSDIPQYIFDCSHTCAWNKLYRRSFVLENRLRFQNSIHTNDLLFVCLSMVKARRITYLDRKLISYRVNHATSLSSGEIRRKYPFLAYKAFVLLRKELESMNIFDVVKQSYVDRFLSVTLYNLDKLKGDDYIEYFYLFKNKWIPELEIGNANESFFNTPVYYKRYKEIISSEPKLFSDEIKLFSFDIFDTLISRKVATPHGIFALMKSKIMNNFTNLPASFVSNFVQLRIEVEKFLYKYRCDSTHEDISIEDIYDVICNNNNIDIGFKKELIDLEIETEIENLIPIEKNIKKMEYLLKINKKVVLISDMYFSSDVIRNMLVRISRYFENIPIYVSSDFSMKKYTGSLYEKVKELENVDYREWFHFGDNQHSDIEKAKEKGILTERFEYPKLEIFEEKLIKNDEFNISNQRIVGIAKNLRLKDTDIMFQYGCSLGGILFFPYISWVLEQAEKKGIKRLYFIARDGFLLKKIADLIIAYKRSNIKTFYLCGSRDIWRLPAALLKQRDLDFIFDEKNSIETFQDIAEKLYIKKYELLSYLPNIWREKNKLTYSEIQIIKKILLSSVNFIDFLNKKNKERIALTLKYLQDNVDVTDDNFAFVEFRGSGVTQDMLGELIHDFSSSQIRTFYYYLTADVLNGSSEKIVYFPMVTYATSIFEILLRSLHGQTIDYYEKNNKVYPEFESNEGIALIKSGYSKYISGVISFVTSILSDASYNSFAVNTCFNISLFYLSIFNGNELDKKTADFLGSIPFKMHGRQNDNEISFYAPMLSTYHLKKVFLDGEKSIYNGANLKVSQARMLEKDIFKKYKTDLQSFHISSVLKQAFNGKTVLFVNMGNTDNKRAIYGDALSYGKNHLQLDFDLQDFIWINRISWDPVHAHNCNVLLKKFSVVHRDGRVENFSLKQLQTSGEVNGDNIVFKDVKPWIACNLEGVYRKILIEADVDVC